MQNRKSFLLLNYKICVVIFIFIAFNANAQENRIEKDSVNLSIQLSEAVLENDINAVDSLIKIGAKVNIPTIDGVTPLMYASQEGNLPIMKKLILAGANINIIPDNKITALLGATISNKKEAILLLLQNGANIESKDDEQNSALLIAARNNNIEAVKLFLSFNADVNVHNTDEYNALHFAASSGNDSMLILLVNSGINLNKKDKLGFTPIMVATAENKNETAELLLSYGADLNLVNSENLSVLSFAILNGNAYLTELYLLNGADGNHLSGKARDHWYFSQGTGKTIKKLLRSFDVKRNIKPVFETLFLGTNLGISEKNLKTSLVFGVKESKYNFHLQTALGFTPFVYSSRDLIDGKTYQFWQRDYWVSLELDKYFSFMKSFNTEFGMYGGIEPGLRWGTYRGTKIDPLQKYVLSPVGGLFIRKYFLESRIDYKYDILNNSDTGIFSIQFIIHLNRLK